MTNQAHVSKSETGHSRNLSNTTTLLACAERLGQTYAPELQLVQLQPFKDFLDLCKQYQDDVQDDRPSIKYNINQREALYQPLNTTVTNILKLLPVTPGVTPAMIEDIKSVADKIRGHNKAKATTDPDPDKKKHSTSQMSYDQRASHFREFIVMLQALPQYNPAEQQYQLPILSQTQEKMLQFNQTVNKDQIEIAHARTLRNQAMYQAEDCLAYRFKIAKQYILTLLPKNTPDYNLVMGLKFTPIKKN